MADFVTPAARGLPGITWPPQRRSLRDLQVDLRWAQRLPKGLCTRRRVLVFGAEETAAWLLVPPRAEPALAEEVAFALGRPVVTFQPADGNLPELIERVFEAVGRGETVFSPEDAAAANLGAGLVFLEDLGDPTRVAARDGVGAGISLGALDELGDSATGSVAGPDSAPPGPSAIGARSAPVRPTALGAPSAPPVPPAHSSLPKVVDLDGGEAVAPDPADPETAGEELLSDELAAPLLDVDLLEDETAAEQRLRGVAWVAAQGPGAQWATVLAGVGVGMERVAGSADLLARLRSGDEIAVVLLDGGLPGLEVFDLCRQIRRVPGGQSAALVVVPPVHLDDWAVARDAARVYGVDVLVSRWWDEAVFCAAVQAALGRRGHPEAVLGNGTDQDAAQDLQRRAAERYRSGDVAQAVRLYEAGLALDPTSAPLYVGIARARVKQRRPDEALHWLERAAALDPESVPTLRSLAVLYEKRGFVTRAVDAWLRVLAVTAEPEARQAVVERLRALLDACGPQRPERT